MSCSSGSEEDIMIDSISISIQIKIYYNKWDKYWLHESNDERII